MPEVRNTEKFIIKAVDNKEFDAFFKENRARVFDKNITIDSGALYDDTTKDNINRREREISTQRMNFFFVLGDKIIGWSFGKTIDAETFYMINTGIFKSFQNMGFYTRFLGFLIQKLKKEGVQIITSRHHTSNNPVLIPKLKKGFFITGLVFDEKFGFLVSLSFYSNPNRKKIFNHRIGYESFDEFQYFLKKNKPA